MSSGARIAVMLLAVAGLWGGAPAQAAVFLSTKVDRANMRLGPGLDYPVRAQFRIRHWPLELLDRYGDWRRVRDWHGEEGWMHKRLLSPARYVLIRPQHALDAQSATELQRKQRTIRLYRAPHMRSRVVAFVQTGVSARLEDCDIIWCKIRLPAHAGWVVRVALWGLDEREFRE